MKHAKKIIDFLINVVGYRKIIASCDSLNRGSSKVLEKANMTLEGILREQIIRKDGTYGDIRQYGILANDFLIR